MVFGNFYYYELLEKFVAFNKWDFFKVLKQLEEKRHLGFLVGYIRYEAWRVLDHQNYKTTKPLLYFELFAKRKPFVKTKTNFYTFYPQISNTQDFHLYKTNIAKIKRAIRRGDTYQVNYTYPIKLKTQSHYQNIFNEILKNQDTDYKALIQNDYETILSFSPELFFKVEGKKITTQPMKGTIKRVQDEFLDQKNKQDLQNSEKNQSENVMIVDLLRNDLSRISHNVKVEKLFEILSYKTLHQMISEIQAVLRDNITLIDILKALFPCGSITGAPKYKTIQIIQELEKNPRGVYCGLIGVIEKDKMCFNVPIRTLHQERDSKELKLNVGSGIVWDSKAKEEYKESILKSLFIYPKIDFLLVETMLVKGGKIQNFSYHKKRMLDSADYFGFKIPNFQEIKKPKDGILRITLNKQGRLKQEYKRLEKLTTTKIVLSENPIEHQNDFLYHKTTYAPWYEKTREKIRQGEFFDCIFYNKNNELTEGARSNLVLQINQELLTPRLDCGLLNGIMRKKMLRKKQIKEKVLFLEDLKRAEKIFCINSVRGVVEVFL
ncbi:MULTISPECIES: chorismate-binding protein [unclassified Helicobacter]|uniref:chorismate-binding protein n=1 Tax=unclassified Helicobacter TaxID=2593540 RepID=UPI000CF106F0|nr:MULTISPECIES: bifunctional anthranilate synthase component I family protein/class IV aminotransferase [unclassified Helicobacter]